MSKMYLPIGSVVVPKESPEQELLIMRNNISVGEINKDYLCNIISSEGDLKFVHVDEDEIKRVLFIGYQK